jgi:hypothetical protein
VGLSFRRRLDEPVAGPGPLSESTVETRSDCRLSAAAGSVAESARAALVRRVERAAPKGMSCEEHPALGLPSPIDGLSGTKHESRSHGERGAIPPGAVQISPSPTCLRPKGSAPAG